jgi:hypothetical protein
MGKLRVSFVFKLTIIRLICDGVNIYPFKGAAKSDNEKFKTFDDNKDELGFAAKP